MQTMERITIEDLERVKRVLREKRALRRIAAHAKAAFGTSKQQTAKQKRAQVFVLAMNK